MFTLRSMGRMCRWAIGVLAVGALTSASRADILTYANSTTQQGIHPDWVIGTLEISDDIHRVSDAPITAVDIA